MTEATEAPRWWQVWRWLFRRPQRTKAEHCERRLDVALQGLSDSTSMARKHVDAAKRVVRGRTRKRRRETNPFDVAELARQAARRKGNGSR